MAGFHRPLGGIQQAGGILYEPAHKSLIVNGSRSFSQNDLTRDLPPTTYSRLYRWLNPPSTASTCPVMKFVAFRK